MKSDSDLFCFQLLFRRFWRWCHNLTSDRAYIACYAAASIFRKTKRNSNTHTRVTVNIIGGIIRMRYSNDMNAVSVILSAVKNELAQTVALRSSKSHSEFEMYLTLDDCKTYF